MSGAHPAPAATAATTPIAIERNRPVARVRTPVPIVSPPGSSAVADLTGREALTFSGFIWIQMWWIRPSGPLSPVNTSGPST